MRILIVDDDPATVSFMTLAFEAAGHTVATAASVDQAMRDAALNPPEVVLSDLTFRRGKAADGFELLRALREGRTTRHVGVLAVSGADSPTVRQAASERGFDGFVSKPVDVASLIDRVQRLGDVVAERLAGQSDIDRV